MKGTVNPFEPWRPAEVNAPPPLHASRPWRPSPPARAAVEELPFAEPVEPPRNKPTEHPPRPKRPQDGTDRRSGGGTPVSQLAIVVLLGLLLVLGLDGLSWLRGTHLPRLAALGASAALLVGVSLSRRRSWRARLTGTALALALAGFAVWFVPTMRGVSLWSSYRQVEELRSPAGRGCRRVSTRGGGSPSVGEGVSELRRGRECRRASLAAPHGR